MALTALQRLVALGNGTKNFITGTITGGTSAFAYMLAALGANGKLDVSVMPDGIGPDVLTGTAAEALSAGALVNIGSDGTIRLADQSNSRPAHGFVATAVAANATATVYKYGTITTTGMTPGSPVFLGASGALVQYSDTNKTPVTTAGAGIWQQVGVASSATTVEFNPLEAITL